MQSIRKGGGVGKRLLNQCVHETESNNELIDILGGWLLNEVTGD